MGAMEFNYCDVNFCVIAVCTANRIETQQSCTFNPDGKRKSEKRCIHCRLNLRQTGKNGKTYYHCDNFEAQRDARKKITPRSDQKKKNAANNTKDLKQKGKITKKSKARQRKEKRVSVPIKSQSDIIKERLRKIDKK